jgi:Na+/H+-dicarboxylate symporter
MASTLGRFFRAPAGRALVGLLFGLIVGVIVVSSGSLGARAAAAAIEPVGTLWVNAIRMTIVPLVASLLISTLSAESKSASVGRLGVRCIAMFVAMLAGVAVIGILAGPPIISFLHVDPASAASLRASATSAATAQTQVPGFGSWLVALVPANPIKAAADGVMLPVIVFSVIFGLALARTSQEVRVPTAAFFRAVTDAMLVLVKWVLFLAPIGVFALAIGLALHLGTSLAGAVAFFLAAHCGLVLAIGALIYVLMWLSGAPMRRFSRATLPAQIVATGTRSSVAALPAMIDGAERVLEISPEVAGVVLPLGVSLFRVNTPASWIISCLFIGKLYGIPLGLGAVVTVGLASIPMSLSVPGIPSGGLLILAPLFVAVGVPVEGIGILIALDAIPDVFKTVVIVTGHMAAATLVSQRAPAGRLRSP